MSSPASKLTFCIGAVLLAALPASAGVVTLDFNQRAASSDTPDLAPIAVQVKNEQIGVYVRSTILQPQTFTFKVTGLKKGNYDVHVNDTRFQEEVAEELRKQFGLPETRKSTEPGITIRGKSAEELAEGIRIAIPGTPAEPVATRCLEATRPKLEETTDYLQMYRDQEAKRVISTLRQALGWVASALGSEETYRSASIIVAPVDMELQSMRWRHMQDAQGTVTTMSRACNLLQMARSRMYDVITDDTLRHLAVAALTPVKFTVSYTMAENVPHVEATLTNNCDIPISGHISMALPRNWKTNAKSLAFDRIRSGSRFDLSFDLISPTQGEEPPWQLPIAANVVLTQTIDLADFNPSPTVSGSPKPQPRPFTAKLKLRTVVTLK